MRSLVIVVVTVVSVACSHREQSKHDASRASTSSITIFDLSDQLLISLDSKNTIRDGAARRIGGFDDSRREVVVDKTHQTLDGVIAINGQQIEVNLPLGEFRVELRGDALWIDGKQFGRVKGVGSSHEEMRRLSALVVAIPMLPTSARSAPADAAVEEPPPPPPPQPPH